MASSFSAAAAGTGSRQGTGSPRPPHPSNHSYAAGGGNRQNLGGAAGGGGGPKKPAWGNRGMSSPGMTNSNLPNGGSPVSGGGAWRAPTLGGPVSTGPPAATNAAGTNGVSSTTTSAAEEKGMMDAMHDRLVWLMVNLIGTKLVVHLKSGPPLAGILSSATTDSELCLTLSRAYPVPALAPSSASTSASSAPPLPSHPDEVKHSVIILGKELVDIEVVNLDWDERLRSDAAALTSSSGPGRALSPGEGKFRTDAETTGEGGFVREKQLQSWSSAGPGDAIGGGLDDDTKDDDLESTLFGSASNNRTFSKPWDQFEANERLFGSKTDFDEEIYTTRLDRSGKDFKDREKRAERLANEILKGTGGPVNAHVKEERGLADDSGLNEEDKYGAVVRGDGAYVPPGARRAAAAAAAKSPTNGVSPTPPSIPTITTSTAPSAATTDAEIDKNVVPSTAASPALPPSQILASRKESSTSIDSAGPAAGPSKTAADASPSPDRRGEMVAQFKSFVVDERKRMQAQKQAKDKKDHEAKFAELRAFASSFKLPMAVPKDMVGLLAKDEAKQKAMLVKKQEDDEKSKLAVAAAAPSEGSEERVRRWQERNATAVDSEEWKARNAAATADLKRAIQIAAIPSFKPRGAPAASPGAGVLSPPSISATPVPAAASAATSPKSASLAPKFGGASIQEIPPFRPKPSPSPVKDGAKPSTSTKLSLKAPVFNPAAKAFTPTQSVSAAPVASSSTGSVDTGSPNAFFGVKPAKRGSSSLHLKEDFTPFKSSSPLPDPTTVAPQWGFTGRPYRANFNAPPGGPGGHPQQSHPHQMQGHFPQPSQHHPGLAGPAMHMQPGAGMPGPQQGMDDEPNLPPGAFGHGGPPGMVNAQQHLGMPPQGFGGMYPYPQAQGPYRGGYPNGPGGPGGPGPQHLQQMPMGGPPVNHQPGPPYGVSQMGFVPGPNGGPPNGPQQGQQPVYGGQVPPHMAGPHGAGQPGMFSPGMFPGQPGRGPPMQGGMPGGPNGPYGYQPQPMQHHFGGPPDGRMQQGQMHGPPHGGPQGR